jgi:RimJ/RimL family protein N-acetyltransferase
MGAFRPQLVGAVGLYRDRYLKSSHKMHLWGLYVTSSHRRQGVASHLLNAVLRHAAYLPGVSWVHLKVSVATPGALRLYEKAGFHVWGTEPAGPVTTAGRLPTTTWLCAWSRTLTNSPTHHSIWRYDGSFCCIDGQLSRKKLIVSVMT